VRYELTGPHSHTILTSVLRLAAGQQELSLGNFLNQPATAFYPLPLSFDLKSACVPSESDMDTENRTADIWSALNQLRTPASLPSGAVLAVSVEDPRVSFPPSSVNKAMRARDQARPSTAQVAQQVRWRLTRMQAVVLLHVQSRRADRAVRRSRPSRRR
jgi:hypothetical protein